MTGPVRACGTKWRWRESEDAVIRELYAARGVDACLPRLPGRKRRAVMQRASALHINSHPQFGGPKGCGVRSRPAGPQRDERAPRRCLRCREMFDSAHKTNRLCRTCKASHEFMAGGIGGRLEGDCGRMVPSGAVA